MLSNVCYITNVMDRVKYFTGGVPFYPIMPIEIVGIRLDTPVWPPEKRLWWGRRAPSPAPSGRRSSVSRSCPPRRNTRARFFSERFPAYKARQKFSGVKNLRYGRLMCAWVWGKIFFGAWSLQRGAGLVIARSVGIGSGWLRMLRQSGWGLTPS